MSIDVGADPIRPTETFPVDFPSYEIENMKIMASFIDNGPRLESRNDTDSPYRYLNRNWLPATAKFYNLTIVSATDYSIDKQGDGSHLDSFDFIRLKWVQSESSRRDAASPTTSPNSYVMVL